MRVKFVGKCSCGEAYEMSAEASPETVKLAAGNWRADVLCKCGKVIEIPGEPDIAAQQ